MWIYTCLWTHVWTDNVNSALIKDRLRLWAALGSNTGETPAAPLLHFLFSPKKSGSVKDSWTKSQVREGSINNDVISLASPGPPLRHDNKETHHYGNTKDWLGNDTKDRKVSCKTANKWCSKLNEIHVKGVKVHKVKHPPLNKIISPPFLISEYI